MRTDATVPRGSLAQATDAFSLRPLAQPEEVPAGLEADLSYWGFYTTPAEARLLCAPRSDWVPIAARPDLQELRVFGEDRDLHWLEGRGIALELLPKGAPPGLAGTNGWWQRERRSRLWGEWLEGSESWYEERIPDPQRYAGLEPCLGNSYAFLTYVEYVQAGAVRYVRYRGIEGSGR